MKLFQPLTPAGPIIQRVAAILFPQRAPAILSFVLCSSLILSACATSERKDTNASQAASATTATETSSAATAETSPNAPPGASQSPAAESAQPAASSSPAASSVTLAEAQAAVARIYKTAVTVEAAGRAGAPFFTGDFNNDGAQDIAVVVRPSKWMLGEINGEHVNWIIDDVSKVDLPVMQNGRQVLPPAPEPVKIEANDQLLVVIHGYKAEGWRSQQAQQTYLLKNAVGENMHAQSIKYALAGASAKNPHLGANGDVIKATREKREGFIYWTGSKYAWRQ